MKALYGIALSVFWRISVEPLIKSFGNLQYWKCLVRTVKHERCLHFTQHIVTHVKATVFSTETLWNCFVSPTLPHAPFLSLSDLSLNQPFLTKHQLFFFFFVISVAYTCLLFTTAGFFFSSATTSKCHTSSGNSCVMMDCPNAWVSPYSPEMKLVCYYKVIISW